jgi:indole-3-glycerol phosphate synthase
MTILDTILGHKLQEVEQLKAVVDVQTVRRLAEEAPRPRDLIAAVRNCPHVPIIAEIKRASPSAGTIKEVPDVRRQARLYEEGGAVALSVLTDFRFFRGTLDDLTLAREAVSLPVLRKDFIVDPLQIYGARMAGADAVLLIAAALDQSQMLELFEQTLSLAMTPVVEVHSKEELERVLSLKPPIVGINNRDLRSMQVSLETCLKLRPFVPKESLVLAESGIKSAEDIVRLRQGGVDAFLIGTTLMKSSDPSATLAGLCRAGD